MKFKKGDIVDVVAKGVQEGTVGTIDSFSGTKDGNNVWKLQMCSMAGSWEDFFTEDELKIHEDALIKIWRK